MAWASIPNFGDKFAKINERSHSSGARLIEVLYGARDSYGRPTSPESTEDGHGHWLALEIDGTYQMLSWRHPTYEGGYQEYGYSRSNNALSDLEADISAKEAICSQADSLSYCQEWKTVSSEFNRLFEEWKKIYNWGTPKEKQLWERFQSLKKAFYERRDNERAKNKISKQNVISEAKSLANSSDWKNTGQRFKELFERWKSIGSAGKNADDYLWTEFNTARKTFYDRRSKHFSIMDEQRSKNRKLKQALISEAGKVENPYRYMGVRE